MRELKFRAWWKDTKRFLDCDEWYMTCSGAKYLHYAVMPYKDDNFIIEQFTGLKDKDGKEIYEGDIVDYNDDCECIGVVKYDAPEFYLEADLEIHAKMFLKGAPHQKVIGNIHENSELLKDYLKN